MMKGKKDCNSVSGMGGNGRKVEEREGKERKREEM